MKVRFHVTVDVPIEKTALSGKRSKTEEKEYAAEVVTDLVNASFAHLIPNNLVVRFPRAT